MAHRPGTEQSQSPASVTVRLPDLEPVLGLMAAISRFCDHLDAETVRNMPDGAARALSQIQSIMWGLEHSKPEE